MSVSNQTNKTYGDGNGVTTTFSFSFKIFDVAELNVYLINKTTGVVTGPLTYTTDYTATINAVTEGGTVIFVVAPTTNQQWFVARIVPYTQSAVIPSEGTLPGKQIENQLDLMTMMIIQANEAVGRCLKVPITSSAVIVLPSPQDGYSLAWDGTGGNLKNVLIDADAIAAQVALAQAAAAGAATSQTAAAASATATAASATAAAASATAAAASAASIVGVAFSVTKSGVQALSDVTNTKVTWETVDIDTGSYFASNKFTPLVAGKYFVHFQAQFNSFPDAKSYIVSIYKNGVAVSDMAYTSGKADTNGGVVSYMASMNGSTDYLEAYAYQNTGGSINLGGSPDVRFMGFKVA